MNEKNLLNLMNSLSIEEKIGQLIQITPDFFDSEGEVTGPAQAWNLDKRALYQVGSVLGTHTREQVEMIQKKYLQRSKHKIPLLFMADVIHGYEHIFPIPLALAASFDEKVVERMAHYSAKEAADAGIHVTFSPMADHVTDARWGRVLESSGEDPRLAARLTAAYVRGYQGESLDDPNKIASCVKHFVGYGAAKGGRDYNEANLSDVELYQNYLPAFQQAIEAGAKFVMTAFQSVSGVPMTANRPLIQHVLRELLKFEGVVISDWGAVQELCAHRVAENSSEAAKLAFQAGIEIEMMSNCYHEHLEHLVSENGWEELLDQAVWRILMVKNELNLFENPYRSMNSRVHSNEYRKVNNEIAIRTPVLLKNEHQVLPLKKNEKIVLLGSKADSQDVLGAWSWIGKQEMAISLKQGLVDGGNDTLTFIKGTPSERLQDAEVVRAIQEADKIIVAIGETSEETGEAASKVHLRVPFEDQLWLDELHKMGKVTIAVIFAGRPLVLTDIEPKVDGLVMAWFPGSEAGHILAQLLTGDFDFSGRLPMSFPQNEGQLPLTYQQMETGRPLTQTNYQEKYLSKYLDCSNDPLYEFGFGLQYATVSWKDIQLSTNQLSDECSTRLTMTVSNDATIPTHSIVQLYMRDEVTTVVRPMIELLDVKVVKLEPQQKVDITFTIDKKDLKYVHADLTKQIELGRVTFFIGESSKRIVWSAPCFVG
ncbi:glycoside hydrolase family 3 N-terminal domain-containing protein [Enterococcus camelliae]|uniref:beta-glucosidase n=1 Tax=Enterococcus camelliae TaxID=453959 RepID=A0ABW5TFQ0_9ENTE